MGSKLDQIYSELRRMLRPPRPENVLVPLRLVLRDSIYQIGPIERSIVTVGVYRENGTGAVIAEIVLITGMKVLVRISEDPSTGEIKASVTAFGPVVSVHAPRL